MVEVKSLIQIIDHLPFNPISSLSSFNFESSWVYTCREKLYATTFEENNPIADAVTTQCPHLAKQLHNPYERRLGGDEILKILCEGQCEQQKTYGR